MKKNQERKKGKSEKKQTTGQSLRLEGSMSTNRRISLSLSLRQRKEGWLDSEESARGKAGRCGGFFYPVLKWCTRVLPLLFFLFVGQNTEPNTLCVCDTVLVIGHQKQCLLLVLEPRVTPPRPLLVSASLISVKPLTEKEPVPSGAPETDGDFSQFWIQQNRGGELLRFHTENDYYFPSFLPLYSLELNARYSGYYIFLLKSHPNISPRWC